MRGRRGVRGRARGRGIAVVAPHAGARLVGRLRCDRVARAMTRPHDRTAGFVAAEWVISLALLLLPVVMIVGSLPSWVERRHAATVAAREAATLITRDVPDVDAGRAVL